MNVQLSGIQTQPSFNRLPQAKANPKPKSPAFTQSHQPDTVSTPVHFSGDSLRNLGPLAMLAAVLLGAGITPGVTTPPTAAASGAAGPVYQAPTVDATTLANAKTALKNQANYEFTLFVLDESVGRVWSDKETEIHLGDYIDPDNDNRYGASYSVNWNTGAVTNSSSYDNSGVDMTRVKELMDLVAKSSFTKRERFPVSNVSVDKTLVNKVTNKLSNEDDRYYSFLIQDPTSKNIIAILRQEYGTNDLTLTFPGVISQTDQQEMIYKIDEYSGKISAKWGESIPLTRINTALGNYVNGHYLPR